MVVLDLRPLQCGYAGKGIGRYTLELARRIASQGNMPAAQPGKPGSRPHFEIRSLVMAGMENPLPGIPVLITAPAWKRPWLWDQVLLPLALLRLRVSVFHNFTALGPVPQVSFPILARYRGIATVHDWHMFAEDASEIEKFYRRTLRIRIQKKGLPKVRRIVVDAEQMKVETLMLGVPADHITVVHPGCDHFDAVPSEPWPKENFVLSVGDTPNKNLPFAQEVLALLRSRFIHLNWVIVGKRQQVLQALGATAASLPEWITILEAPNDGILKSCYQKALALVFPSTREGFGIPVLEAMRLGCPVLASDIEPLKSLLDYPPGTLPVNAREPWCTALSKLLYDPEARRAASQAGSKRSESFTWDKAAEALISLYSN